MIHNTEILNHAKLADITNGFVIGKFTFTSLSINSTTILKDQIFLAIKGKNLDGHDFIEEAFKKGAQAAIVDQSYYKKHKEKYTNYNLLIVKDTYQALIDIAKYKRSVFKGKVIAITGSMGKTTLKDMVVASLSKYYKVHFTIGNYNNHIGLPLCLTNLSNFYDVSVLELGMSSKGEIEFLTKLVKPDIATITEITAAHLEYFSSVDDILKAKLEILEGLTNSSYFFINASSIDKDKILDSCQNSKISNIYFFNAKEISYNSSVILDYSIYFTNNNDFGSNVKASILGTNIEYKIQSIYKHNIELSCLALSIGIILNCPINKLIQGIESFNIINGRGNIFSVKYNDKDILVINDSYNANYKSMQAAILATDYFTCYSKVLILGEMLELGDASDALHNKLYNPILSSSSDLVLLVGNNMKSLYELLKLEIKVIFCPRWEDAYDLLLDNLKDNSLVLLKGSNSSGIYNIAIRIKDIINNVKE